MPAKGGICEHWNERLGGEVGVGRRGERCRLVVVVVFPGSERGVGVVGAGGRGAAFVRGFAPAGLRTRKEMEAGEDGRIRRHGRSLEMRGGKRRPRLTPAAGRDSDMIRPCGKGVWGRGAPAAAEMPFCGERSPPSPKFACPAKPNLVHNVGNTRLCIAVVVNATAVRGLPGGA